MRQNREDEKSLAQLSAIAVTRGRGVGLFWQRVRHTATQRV